MQIANWRPVESSRCFPTIELPESSNASEGSVRTQLSMETELSVSLSLDDSRELLLLRKSEPRCLRERLIRPPRFRLLPLQDDRRLLLMFEEEDRRMDSAASVEVYVSSCPNIALRR